MSILSFYEKHFIKYERTKSTEKLLDISIIYILKNNNNLVKIADLLIIIIRAIFDLKHDLL